MRSSPSLRRRLRRSIAVVGALALTAAACGDGGDTTTPATDDTTAPATDPATTTDDSSSTTPTTDSGTTTPTTSAPLGPETSDRATTTTSDAASTTSSTASPTSSTGSTSTSTSTTTSTTATTTTTSTTSPDDGEPPLQRGDENELVSFWQDGLNRWLELSGSDTFRIAVDGIFGPQTEGATIEFQNAVDDIKADGVVDPIDRIALEDAITALEAGGGSTDGAGLARIDVQPGGGDENATIFGIVTAADVIDVDAEIEAINDVLGQPTGDSGWLPMPTDQLPCKRDTEHREVVWNDLRLSFERGFEGANLGAWNLGAATILAPENPTPLQGRSNVTTLAGVGPGSPRSDLAAYEAVLDSGNSFSVRSGHFSFISFDLTDDRVVSIWSGPLDCLDPDEQR